MDELTPLTNATLHALPERIKRPSYDRKALTPGIVHIGLGNFHRAHQAWYLHRLMTDGHCLDWAIVGAGVRPEDAIQRDILLSQDCMTTLIELDPAGPSAEITGAMIDFLPVEPDNASLVRQIMDPAIRIVSLTVTEGGYFVDPATGGFDENHPDIVHDRDHPNAPKTAFGAIIAALRHRRANAAPPPSLLSCDNLQGNGTMLRQTVVSLARLSDPDLADWIDERCAFPNSMVDCIVPATGPKVRSLAHEFGVDDRSPVSHENYRQWVIEDHFSAGRPAWERIGAIFSNDVERFEAMKIRILNAGHQFVANPGDILSLRTIADCMAHPLIRSFFRKLQLREVAPHLTAVPEMTPQAYIDLIERRFANPAIEDTTRRVAFDGSSRHTGFVLPIVRDGLARNVPVEGLALVEALWARMCAGTRENGTIIEPNDPHWDSLYAAANAARTQPKSWLEQSWLYGDLEAEPRFRDAFVRWLELIWRDGCQSALSQYVSD